MHCERRPAFHESESLRGSLRRPRSIHPIAKRRPGLAVASISALVAVSLLIASGCSRVPITGRRSFNLVPDSQAMQLGDDAYKQVLQQNKIITSGPDYDQMMRVGRRIAEVANEPSFQWEFSLIDDSKTANAFACRGKGRGVQRHPSGDEDRRRAGRSARPRGRARRGQAWGGLQMTVAQKGAAPPEFLSDHPSDERRVKQLDGWMPEAEKNYTPRSAELAVPGRRHR